MEKCDRAWESSKYKRIGREKGSAGGIFSISSLVKISIISLIASLSLKLYLNSLVYDRNIFGLPWKSSAIFGNLKKSLENVRQRSCDLRTSFGESSEIFGKWSEILEKWSKTPTSVCLYEMVDGFEMVDGYNHLLLHGWLRERTRWIKSCAVNGYPSGRDGAILPARDYPLCPARKISPKAFIGQSCSVKMAWYWPRSFLRVYGPRLRLGP